LRFAAFGAPSPNQCRHPFTGEPSPGHRNQPW